MWRTALLCVLLGGVLPSTQYVVVRSADEPGPDSTTEAPTEATSPTVRSVETIIDTLQIYSEIKYRYATTGISAKVVNANNQSGEASFTITLPESAFISQFIMEVDGKEYKGYVKEKEDAKETYENAVQAGLSAGHIALQARDSNKFTVSVNLEALGTVSFHIQYEQLLTRDLGLYSHVISIDPKQIVENLWVTVNIEEPSAIKNLQVPEIQTINEVLEETKPNALAKIEEKSANHMMVSWAPTPEEQKAMNSTGVSGQFIVRYDVVRDNSQQILMDEGHFVHFFAPEDLPQLRKHVVFVLDYSGSMYEDKLEQLKAAMKKILSDLEPKDFFSIVLFQSYVEVWALNKVYVKQSAEEPGWRTEVPENLTVSETLDKDFVVEATQENIILAQTYLETYPDLGATYIIGGLRVGLELVNISSEMWSNESDPPQPIIVFLTDGQANVEEFYGDEIVNKIKPLNTRKCPIYSLAFGYDADWKFLRKLSLTNFGFARIIYEAADADRQLEKLYRTIASPLLTNVTFTYLPGQIDDSSYTRAEFPVFYNGSELVVAGKANCSSICLPNPDVKLVLGELTGHTASGPLKLNVSFDCATVSYEDRASASHLEKAWAFLSTKQLLDKYESLDPEVSETEKDETKAKALKLALQYSFVTPLTSLVVVKPDSEESALDPEKVQPGAEDSSSALSAQEEPSEDSAPVRAPDDVSATASKVGAEIQPVSSSIPTPLIHKVSLEKVKWLQSYLASSGNVTVSVLGTDLVLGLNETDTSFGACTVNNEPGECRHIKFCALDVFQDDVSLYSTFQCPIPNSFLGVCCPQTVN